MPVYFVHNNLGDCRPVSTVSGLDIYFYLTMAVGERALCNIPQQNRLYGRRYCCEVKSVFRRPFGYDVVSGWN